MSDGKLERLLDLIAELLDAPRPITAAQIHARLPGYPEDRDSFKRAFERDKKDLREMGVPLEVVEVPGTSPVQEGYRIDPDEYFLPDPGLDSAELAALHLAASAVRLDGDRASAGLRKLGGDAPNGPAAPRTELPGAPHLVEVFAAVSEHREASFRYGGKDRIVDPWRLHHQRGRWYLLGHDRDAGASRSFRLDRIDGPVSTGDRDSATRPSGREPTPLELDGWAQGDAEPIDATVRIGAGAARVAARQLGARATLTWDDDGSVEAVVPVRRVEGFRNFVLEFLDEAEVIGPPDLRADLVDWLTAIVEQGS